MNITTADDKKEKYQSWTAHTEANDSTPMSDYDVSLIAYGATEVEAKTNLLMAAIKLRDKIACLVHDLTLELPCVELDKLVPQPQPISIGQVPAHIIAENMASFIRINGGMAEVTTMIDGTPKLDCVLPVPVHEILLKFTVEGGSYGNQSK